MKNRRIAINGTVLFGKPRIRGTRISVEQVLACLAEGWSEEKIMEELGIQIEDIRAAVDFAYQALSRTHFLPSDSPHASLPA